LETAEEEAQVEVINETSPKHSDVCELMATRADAKLLKPDHLKRSARVEALHMSLRRPICPSSIQPGDMFSLASF